MSLAFGHLITRGYPLKSNRLTSLSWLWYWFLIMSNNWSMPWATYTCKICILYDFPCEMDFSHHESPNFHQSRLRRGWDSGTSGEKSISHGKPYTMHFLAYFTLQGTLVMLNTLRKVEDHENHVRWIYLTTVLYMGEVRIMRERI